MEPEGSLPCLQDPATDPYPEPDQSSLFLFFFNLHSGGWNQGPLDTAAT
jgi:hypothetical protein